MECTDCKYRKQIALKRCKHFELGGDKKRKVTKPTCTCQCLELTAKWLVKNACDSVVPKLLPDLSPVLQSYESAGQELQS